MFWITGVLLTLIIGGAAMNIPRGIRNNNPGNIRATGIHWKGQKGSDGAFVIFSTPELGYRALGILLLNYEKKYGINTVKGIIDRYAPPTENDTRSYVDHVSDFVGVDANVPIKVRDYLEPMMLAITKHENGFCPFNSVTIASGANAAREYVG